MAVVAGTVASGFDRVREAFASNFDGDEHGAAVVANVGNRCVVDLWGGFIDDAQRRPWERDTLVNCFSVGKGVLSTLVLDCVGRGEIDLDTKLESAWPGAVRLGAELTIRDCMAHRAGVPAVRRPLGTDAMYDWDVMCAALVDQDPYWEPGAAHGYHVNTFGFLVGEIVQRAVGRRLGDLLQERLGGPADGDFHFGLASEHHDRVSRVFMVEQQLNGPEEWALAFPPSGDPEHDSMIWSAYFNPPGFSGLGTVNAPEWRRSVIPSTNSHGNARGIARIFAALFRSGASAVTETLVREASSPHSDGHDIVLGKPSRYGLGFQLPAGKRGFGPSRSAFGHYGYGGSLGLADPVHQISFGYCTNKPGDRFDTRRTAGILDALYQCI